MWNYSFKKKSWFGQKPLVYTFTSKTINEIDDFRFSPTFYSFLVKQMEKIVSLKHLLIPGHGFKSLPQFVHAKSLLLHLTFSFFSQGDPPKTSQRTTNAYILRKVLFLVDQIMKFTKIWKTSCHSGWIWYFFENLYVL